MNYEVKETFTFVLMVSLCKARKPGSYLVLNCNSKKVQLDHLNVVVRVVKCIQMLQKRKHFPIQLLTKSIKSTMNLIATINA